MNQNLLIYWIESFQKFDKRTSKLPLDIFLDINNIYKQIKEVNYPFVIITNGYEDFLYDNDFLAISLKNGEILNNLDDIKIFRKDFNIIQSYILRYKDIFLKIANQELDYFDGVDTIKSKSNIVNESIYLNEMAIMKSKTTNLPFDIWLDDAKLYKSHGNGGYRIKFANKDGNNDSRSWPSIRLHDFKIIDNNNSKYSQKDINKLCNFIYYNDEYIKKLADQEMSFDDFKNAFHKLDDKGNPLPSANEEKYCLYKKLCDGYSIVIDSSKTKFNIRNDYKDEILFVEWYDFISDKCSKNKYGENCYFAQIENKAYQLTLTGRIYPIY